MKPESKKAPVPQEFTSRMSKWELIAALLYLPLHVWLLPRLLTMIPATAELSDLNVNMLVYGIGTGYMLLVLGGFFRREFDPLCDYPVYCVFQIVLSYGMMLAFNMLLGLAMTLILPADQANPNNAAVMELAGEEFGKTAAIAVFLAPLVEEPIFRGSIFGLIRRTNRNAAYAVSMLLFALYHVWGYALQDPIYWVYLLQYLPVSWLLCRCYERCNSIWGSIFLHMMINGISIRVLSSLMA
ncbi:MAG: CPBP family intramembrane metalloprotease [Oscillospiraceae bacterium]|nr:CPBP family intramembrane metalloprotease [Oscillospiraceae bacterium]MBQ3803685.1 CPBP family intramembrane metalloprotease [Oscillospiraceae bacterium]MBQ6427963.1 CPBP family intramembrane metalloprotease [Oscillospiraceae bacterium]